MVSSPHVLIVYNLNAHRSQPPRHFISWAAVVAAKFFRKAVEHTPAGIPSQRYLGASIVRQQSKLAGLTKRKDLRCAAQKQVYGRVLREDDLD
jgi:hypothetical protein